MPLPLIALGMAVPAIANFFSGLFGNSAQNQQRQDLLNIGKGGLSNMQGQQIQDPNALLQQLMGPAQQYGQNLLFNGPQNIQTQITNGQFDQGNFLNSILPELMNPSDMGTFYQSPLGDIARQYDPMVAFLNQQIQGMGGAYQPGIDAANQIGSGQSQGIQALLQRGNNLTDSFGTNAFNMNAQDNAGRNISNGGWNQQTQRLFDNGNELYSSGGMTPQLNALFGAGQGIAGQGGISPQIAALLGQSGGILGGGGFTPGTQNFSQMAQQIPGFAPGSGGGATQSGMFGQSGNAAMAGLFAPQPQQNIPGFGSNFGGQQSPTAINPQQLQQAFQQGMGSGYTPQNMGVGDIGMQGMQQLLARDPQIDQLISYGQQAFGGKLPGGPSNDPYAAQLNSIIGQLGGLSVGGGGGASGASAGQMGAMDPTLAGMLQQGSDYFKNNPLIPMSQRLSMAVNDAGSAANQQAEAAQRFARARGGGGAIVNAGSQNQAMTDFADQSLRARSEALRSAILDQQQLGLTQQMQGAQVGLGAANADTARQQVAASRDIASANNSTQASVANAQTQASMAAQNAQLRAAGLQAAANAALGMRGQDYGQSQAGLQAMLQAQSLANQRGSVFNQDLLGSLQDATSRYNTGMGILPGLTSANAQQMGSQAQMASALAQQMAAQGGYMNQNNANQNSRMATALQGSLQGSELAGNQNNQYAALLAQLGLGGENAANTRLGTGTTGYLGGLNAGNANLGLGFGAMQGAGQLAGSNMGMGLGAMNNAGGLANNTLGLYGGIGNQASQDQLSRMGLGNTMIGSSLMQQLAGLAQGTSGTNGMFNSMNNTSGANNQNIQTQAKIFQDMFGSDQQNRQMGLNGYNGLFGSQNNLLTGIGNVYNGAMNPMASMTNSLIGYQGGANTGYTSILNNLLGQTPQQQNPWPQLSMGNGQSGGLGGLFNSLGGGGQSGGGVSVFNPGGLQGGG